MCKYNEDILKFVVDNVKGRTNECLANMVNEKFKTEFTASSMNAYKVNHKLKSGIRYNGSDKKPRLFSPEITEFIRKNVKGLYNAELTDLVNKTFKTCYNVDQIGNYKMRLHLSSGLTGHFEKGHVPVNKGKKMSPELYEKCKATMFKKGHKNKNERLVGSERIDSKDGYTYVKVANPNVWKLKHVMIWETVYGPVPAGHNVIFLDNNRKNFDIENLAIVSKSINARLNQNNRRSNCAEVTKAGIALEQYKDIVRKVK